VNSGYNLPEWFYDDDVTDQERSDWMTQHRANRRALKQDTPFARAVEKHHERMQRRLEARPDTVNVEKYR